MDNKYKALTNRMSDHMVEIAYKFLFENLQDGENTGDLIDLVLSAHLTSAFSLMKALADGNPLMQEKVNDFIERMAKFIGDLYMINNVEWFESGTQGKQ